MSNESLTKQLSFLDRYLTLWIFVAMGIGVLLSITIPNIGEALESMSVGTTSILIMMMYPLKYGDYKKFDQKNPVNDYEKKIFPYLYYADNFRQDLMEIILKLDSFSFIFNLFSKLLFVYLYDRYLEIKNSFAITDFEIIPAHVIVNHKNKYIIIYTW